MGCCFSTQTNANDEKQKLLQDPDDIIDTKPRFQETESVDEKQEEEEVSQQPDNSFSRAVSVVNPVPPKIGTSHTSSSQPVPPPLTFPGQENHPTSSTFSDIIQRPHSSSKFKDQALKSSRLEEVQDTLKKCGIKKLKLIIGVDYSDYNLLQNRKNSNSRIPVENNNLHELRGNDINPYRDILDVVSRLFSGFGDHSDESSYPIHVFGFGDINTKDFSIFPFILSRNLTSQACKGSQEVLKRYLQTTQTIILSRPTSFAPLIREAIKIVKETKTYHVLIILTAGHIDNFDDTKSALKEASLVSLSVIVVGIGDGPFSQMYELYQTPHRAFENYHFMSLSQIIIKSEEKGTVGSPLKDVALSSNILQEIPAHWTAIKKLGYPK